MNLPSASPNENMNIDSSISPMPARRAERSSVPVEILASRLIEWVTLILRSGLLGRVSKDEASWFETALTRLLTMRSRLRQSRRAIAAAGPLRYRCASAPSAREISHDRVRPRAASHGGAAALVRGFCAWRAFCDSKPHHDDGGFRRLSDRERRYPPRALRRRILPRPRPAEPARAWLSDADPHRAGRRLVSVHGGGVAGRLSRAIEPVSQTGVRRRHDLSGARGDGIGPRPLHRRGDPAQHRVQPAPRPGAGRKPKIPDPEAPRLAATG